MTDELLDDDKSFKSSDRTDEELNDYDLGCEAASDGKPNDDTKKRSLAARMDRCTEIGPFEELRA
jgi:hypothetical protein